MSSTQEETRTITPAPPTTRSLGWFRRYPIAQCLVALVAAFMIAPFEEQFTDGRLIEAIMLSVVLLGALLALGGRRKTLLVGLVLVTPALIATWLNPVAPGFMKGGQIFFASCLLFMGFVIFQLLRFILRAPRIDSEVICAGITTYLLLGLLWGIAYASVARNSPSAFAFTTPEAMKRGMQGFTVVYFSFVTLCTLGYGDIVPVSGAARMLAMMEAITGTFYLAVLVARLVALYSVPRSSHVVGALGVPMRDEESDGGPPP
jgi:hypothetical protein